MFAFPAATPVTTPVVALTVAAAILLLLQVPPLRPLLVKAVVEPIQTEGPPLTVPAFARGFTVMTFVAVELPQPLVNVYVMVAVPAATPVTTPVVAFTVATDVAALLQLPPLRPS